MNFQEKVTQLVAGHKDDELIYVYSAHLGGYYVSTSNDLGTYCETCGDSDWILWKGAARDFMKKSEDDMQEIGIFI